MQRDTLADQTQKLHIGIDRQDEAERNPGIFGSDAKDGIQDIYVLVVREREEAEDATFTVESTPVILQKTSLLPAYTICGVYLLCILATLVFQLYCIGNPEIATVTILPKSQVVKLSGTVQFGHLQSPITISQSQTVAATGHGYQPAANAKGYITFYNGQFQPVTIAAGTILTGATGIQVTTDQDASVPQASPPTFGQVTVPAHTNRTGSSGNIAAFDINTPCCFASVLAKNTGAFSGGQDARTYHTVTQHDIQSISTVMKTGLSQSVKGVLQGQVKSPEQLFILPCTPTVTSDHRIGDEATQVKVTVSQTCSAVVYNSQTLEGKAKVFLATQTQRTIGAGYSIFGTIHVTVKQASVTSTPHPLVFLSFQAQGTWIYALSQTAQQHIKSLIAGKTSEEAMQLLASLPGIERGSIRFTGFGDDSRLPKTTGYIHIILFVV